MVFAASQATPPRVQEGCPAPAELPAAIAELKRQRNAVILAHYYQEPAIQDIADFIGDSLELSRKAAATGIKAPTANQPAPSAGGGDANSSGSVAHKKQWPPSSPGPGV